MRAVALVVVVSVSTVFALDLEALQRSSQRYRDSPMPAMMGGEFLTAKRFVQPMPSYVSMINEGQPRQSGSSMSNSQGQHRPYKTVEELIANVVANGNDNRDLSWMRNRDGKPSAQSSIVRPPYDQDDFPYTYQQLMARLEAISGESAFEANRKAGLNRNPKPKRTYRVHKQLPYSMRVPADEMIRKRSVDELKQVAKPIEEAETQQQAVSEKRDKRITATALPEQQSIADTATIPIAAPIIKPNVSVDNNAKMSSDQFKQWLTDEYYRNMAMSFATMRKRRSIADTDMPPRDEDTAFDRLAMMEQGLLQEAVQLLQSGGGQDRSKLKSQVTERLDVAHDIEKLKKALQGLYNDAQRQKAIDEAHLMAALKESARRHQSPKAMEQAAPVQMLNGPGECPELQMLSSGCSALQGMFPPPPVQDQFLFSCNWHEICYACGARNGLSAEQCDEAFLQDMKSLCTQLGSCNRQMVSLLLEPLHKKRVYYKRGDLPICGAPCVSAFLTGSN